MLGGASEAKTGGRTATADACARHLHNVQYPPIVLGGTGVHKPGTRGLATMPDCRSDEQGCGGCCCKRRHKRAPSAAASVGRRRSLARLQQQQQPPPHLCSSERQSGIVASPRVPGSCTPVPPRMIGGHWTFSSEASRCRTTTAKRRTKPRCGVLITSCQPCR